MAALGIKPDAKLYDHSPLSTYTTRHTNLAFKLGAPFVFGNVATICYLSLPSLKSFPKKCIAVDIH
jgi:hypothetical protein